MVIIGFCSLVYSINMYGFFFAKPLQATIQTSKHKLDQHFLPREEDDRLRYTLKIGLPLSTDLVRVKLHVNDVMTPWRRALWVTESLENSVLVLVLDGF